VIGYHFVLRRGNETGFAEQEKTMGKFEKSKAGKPRNLRETLLDLAVAQVAAQGSEGLMVAQLARELSISTAAPYRHFADRAALVHAVATVGMNRLGARMSAAADAIARPGPQRIVAIGQAYLDFAQTEPHLFNAMFDSQRPNPPTDDSKKLQDAGRATFDILLHHVAQALKEKETAPRPRRIAFALWCFVHGQAALRLIEADHVMGPHTNRDVIMQEIASLFLGNTPGMKSR
jgi:AcrR family transcriptional regulator